MQSKLLLGENEAYSNRVSFGSQENFGLNLYNV